MKLFCHFHLKFIIIFFCFILVSVEFLWNTFFSPLAEIRWEIQNLFWENAWLTMIKLSSAYKMLTYFKLTGGVSQQDWMYPSSSQSYCKISEEKAKLKCIVFYITWDWNLICQEIHTHSSDSCKGMKIQV